MDQVKVLFCGGHLDGKEEDVPLNAGYLPASRVYQHLATTAYATMEIPPSMQVSVPIELGREAYILRWVRYAPNKEEAIYVWDKHLGLGLAGWLRARRM